MWTREKYLIVWIRKHNSADPKPIGRGLTKAATKIGSPLLAKLAERDLSDN